MMGFCPRCGRQRGTSALFCGGCGHAFSPPAAAGAGGDGADDATVGAVGLAPREAADAAPLAADATTADPVPAAEPTAAEPAGFEPAGPNRWDAPAGQTRLDTPAWPTSLDVPRETERPSGYPSWYTEESPDTITARPGGGAGFPPPASPGYPPPSAPPAPQRQPGSRRTGALVIAVVLVALAAGGGAYALAGAHRHVTAQPPGSPTAASSPTGQGPASPVVNASGSPTGSPSPSPTPSPTRTAGVQTAAAAASDPAAPQVVAYLNRYFSAINTHDYGAYQSLLDAQEQAGNSRSQFDSGYASTKDSNEVLTGIAETGGGTLTADVSFTSRQQPANSVDGSACNTWQISLFLVPSGSSYVMTAAPAGYHAGHSDC